MSSTATPPPATSLNDAWTPSPIARWITVAVTLVSALALVVVLPRWADSTTPDAAGTSSDGQVVLDGLTLTPAGGWSVDPKALGAIRLKKADASLLVFAPAPATTSAEEAVAANADIFREDTTVSYQVGDIEAFQTAAGADGASVVVLSPDAATVLFAVSDGTQQVLAQFDAKPASWNDLEEETNAMIRSIVLTPQESQ